MSFELISFKKLSILSINVENKISSKYFVDFIKTSLKLHQQEILPSTKIYISFVSEANIYEIFIINSYYDKIYLELQIFQNISSKKIDLFITDDFFVVYKEKKLYLAKQNKNFSVDDIVYFLNFTYKLKVDNIYYYDSSEFEILKNRFKTSKKRILNYISLEKSYQHIYFIIYLLLLFLFGGYVIFAQLNTLNQRDNIKNIYRLQNLKDRYKSLLQKHQNNPILYKLIVEFFDYLKLYKITLYKLKIDNKFSATIGAKEKTNLYNFISSYKKKIKIKKIYKDRLINFMDIKIEF